MLAVGFEMPRGFCVLLDAFAEMGRAESQTGKHQPSIADII